MAEAEAKTAPAKRAGKTGDVIRVRGPAEGRRRGGIAFGPQEIEIDLSTLDAAQLAAISEDPLLSVTRVAG